MNIFRPQKPYIFRPPKYSPFFAAILRQISRNRFLRSKFKIRDIHVVGVERVGELVNQKNAVLVAPNHADHPDPHVLVHAGRRCGVNFHFMAAREAFEVSRLGGFAMQRIGAFSVDREGADLAAVRMAMEILQRGDNPLVMFPEGEIYHHHEKLDVLNEGVATIVLRAAAKMEDGRKAFLVPAAIRYMQDASIAETFSDRIERLEARVTWKPRPYSDIVERIYHLGGGLLALKEQEFLGRSLSGPLVERIQNFQHVLVDMIENKHGQSPAAERIPERVKWLRNKIRKQLHDDASTLTDRETWELYHDLDTLFTAVQLYSYPGQYLTDQPSNDRIAETLLKLEEDVLGEGRYPSPCEARIRFDEPIDIGQFLAERSLDRKTGVAPLTECMAQRIQGMLKTN